MISFSIQVVRAIMLVVSCVCLTWPLELQEPAGARGEVLGNDRRVL